MGGGREES